MATVSFFNSDQTGEVEIEVEGIAEGGVICRGISRYRVGL
jgi:hypothetical protein